MAGAGSLREKFTIRRATLADDGYGGQTQTWADLLTAAASVQFMRGSETVIAARLQARQPAILTLRTSEAARSVRPEDKAVNDRTGEVFNIRELPRESRNSRGYLEMLVESGVPQ
jgi:head-tail adaptor